MTVAMAGGGPGVHSMLVGQVIAVVVVVDLGDDFVGWRGFMVCCLSRSGYVHSSSPSSLTASSPCSHLGGSVLQPRALELLKHVHPAPGFFCNLSQMNHSNVHPPSSLSMGSTGPSRPAGAMASTVSPPSRWSEFLRWSELKMK